MDRIAEVVRRRDVDMMCINIYDDVCNSERCYVWLIIVRTRELTIAMQELSSESHSID